MASFVFNCALGKGAEKVADAPNKLGIILLKAQEADLTLKSRTTLQAILAAAGNVEADFQNYQRLTGITGTVTQDDNNGRVLVACPTPQTWAQAGSATNPALNNTTAKLIVYYEESASDAGRIPLVALDYVYDTNGSDLLANFAVSGFASFRQPLS